MMVEVSTSDAETVLTLGGEIDMHQEATLRRVLLDVMALPGDLVLDMSSVRFMDSTGLNLVIWASRQISPGRHIRVRHPNRLVRRLFRVSGVDATGNVVVDDAHRPSRETVPGA